MEEKKTREESKRQRAKNKLKSLGNKNVEILRQIDKLSCHGFVDFTYAKKTLNISDSDWDYLKDILDITYKHLPNKRVEVLQDYCRGDIVREIAERRGITVRAVYLWVQYIRDKVDWRGMPPRNAKNREYHIQKYRERQDLSRRIRRS